jgi:AraC-like DNA-binding protein
MSVAETRQRSDAWRHALARAFADLKAEAHEDELPDGRLAGAHFDEVGVFDISGSTQRVRRSPRTVRREPLDLLKVCLVLRGRATVDQDRRHVTLDTGEFALYDTGRPYELVATGPWRCAVMTVPRHVLALPEATLAGSMEHAVGTASGPGNVFASYLRAIVSQRDELGGGNGARLGEAAVALLTVALSGGSRLGDPAALLRIRVTEYVRRHLDDPGLSPATVAAALRMSPRSLHRLFEDDDDTFSRFVRKSRLEAIRRDLGDPLLRDRGIAVLAARRGVTDQSWLSRAFRAEYGLSPSQQRNRLIG